MTELTLVEKAWLVIGFSGQIIFGMRFALQWFKSEQEKRSVIPVGFWYCSIFGAMFLLAYAIHIGDPVFIFGQLFGVFVYSRNLYFIYKQHKAEKLEAEE